MDTRPRGRLMATALGLLLIAGLVIASPGQATSASGKSPAVVALLTSGSGTSTYAVVKEVPVGRGPLGVAVNSEDDTVYVVNQIDDNLSIIQGNTGVVSSTIAVGDLPWGVAVNEGDDTVYIANQLSDNVSIVNGESGTIEGTLGVGRNPVLLALNLHDDTVYVANFDSDQVSVLDGRTGALTDDTIAVGDEPTAIAVNQGDDTVYVANWGDNTIAIIEGLTGVIRATRAVGIRPSGLAIDQKDDTVYVANSGSDTLSILSGDSGMVDDTIPVGDRPWSVAVDQNVGTVYVTNSQDDNVSVINPHDTDDSVIVTVREDPVGVSVDDSGTNMGLVYVTNFTSDVLSVIARVTPSALPSSGAAGSEVTITVNVANLAAGYTFDHSTVSGVSFGGVAGTGLVRGTGNTWKVTAPVGTGAVPVQVTFHGGLAASAGTFTYVSPPDPDPDPILPPSTPTAVSVIAGDSSAEINWEPPASSGTFRISSYQAVVAPGGQSCLVSAPRLSCFITGLSNGATYTATVRALSGAGWGPYSEPSASFTPFAPDPPAPPSILITGVRDGITARVTGTTANFTTEQVRTRVRLHGQKGYRDGVPRPVDSAGTFAWQRTTSKKVYVYFTADGIHSNRVIIPSRR